MKLVTGMHRSGTSLVARVLMEAGGDFGDTGTFHPPDRWNPDGYFEQTEILDLNRALIHGPFGRLAYLRLPVTATIVRRSDALADRLRAAGGRYQGRLVKENRFCLTLPAWRRHGVMFERVLIVLREPFAVAGSLKRRNRITLRYGYALWRVHVERLLMASDDLPRRFLRYDALLDPGRFGLEMGAALRFLGMAVPEGRLEAVRRTCVKPAMNHAPSGHPAYPAEVERLWRSLLERHAGQAAEGASA